jgi:hypothetical protein
MIDSDDSSSYCYVSSGPGKTQNMYTTNQNMYHMQDGNKDIEKKKSYDIEAKKKAIEIMTKRDNQGRSFLHYAAFRGELLMAKQLFCLGFPVDTTDKNLNTSLHVAGENGQLSFVTFLLQQGANINRQNIEGKTALHLSVERGQTQVANLLLNSGASANIQDLQGATPLHYSAANGTNDISKLLLQYGAFVNSRDFAKETPLFYAIRESNSSAVDLFVNKYNADLSITNEDLETPLSFARELSEYDIILILQGKPNQVNMVNSGIPKSQPMQLPVVPKVSEQIFPNYRPQSL